MRFCSSIHSRHGRGGCACRCSCARAGSKVLSDLWGNKVRTLLVVASMAVGLFAVGMIATIHAILSTDIRASYAAVNPANIMINADTLTMTWSRRAQRGWGEGRRGRALVRPDGAHRAG